MGNPKQKWTAEEEQALKDGVAKHGPGKWKCIQKDPQFHKHLSNRTNIDLKDKWRNMSAAAQGTSIRLRTPRPKLTQDAPDPAAPAPAPAPAAPAPAPPAPAPAPPAPAPAPAPAPPPRIQTPPLLPVPREPQANHIREEPVKDPSDAKNTSRYNNEIHLMIFEALAKYADGLDISSMVSYMERKILIETPQTFRKQLGARLRRLVHQERLEKVENCYRLKRSSLAETWTNNRKDVWPRPVIPAHIKIGESSLEEAAKTAAYKVAEAEEKSCSAALSVREAERLSKMQEEADSFFELARQISKRCKCDHNTVLFVA